MVAKKLRNGIVFLPQSLQTLATRACLHLIEDACKSPQNFFTTEKLRGECAITFPWLLRQHLVEELLKTGRLYNTLQLYVLDVLLTEDIRRLAVRHVRRFYRNHFIDLLASGRASGLQVLLFEDTTWLTGNPAFSTSFAVTFSTLPNLRQVSLRFVCDDIILAGLGTYCPNLQEIDTSGSLAVTDVGLQKLCLKAYTNFLPPSPRKARHKSASRSVKRFLRSVFFDCFLETALDKEAQLPNWWRSSVIHHAKKNLCCDTLLVLNVMSTSISHKGVEFLQSSMPNVKILTKLYLGSDNLEN